MIRNILILIFISQFKRAELWETMNNGRKSNNTRNFINFFFYSDITLTDYFNENYNRLILILLLIMLIIIILLLLLLLLLISYLLQMIIYIRYRECYKLYLKTVFILQIIGGCTVKALHNMRMADQRRALLFKCKHVLIYTWAQKTQHTRTQLHTRIYHQRKKRFVRI